MSLDVAWDPGLRREVAVRRGADTTRVVSEARAIARLEHPGVPPVHGLSAGSQEGAWYSTKRVQGQTLEVLLREAATPLGRRLRLFLAVAEVVAYAHGKGVVHGRLCAGAVVVGPFGEVYVTGWGEPGEGGPREDVQALGALLRESVGRQVSGEIEAIIRQAEDPDPLGRYFTVRALIADVLAYLDGRPVGAARYSLLGRLRKRLARRPYLVRGVGAVVVPVAAFGAYLLHEAASRRAARGLEVQRACEAVEEARNRLPARADTAALSALAERWTALVELQPGDHEARRGLFDALLALGDAAQGEKANALADLALTRAGALGVDPARVQRALESAVQAEGADLARGRARILRLLAAAESGELAGEEAFRTAVVEIASYRERQSVDLLLARLAEFPRLMRQGARGARALALVAEGLGRLGDPRGTVGVLSRYLWAERSELRAVPAGVALGRLAQADFAAERELLGLMGLVGERRQGERWSWNGAWWRQVARVYGRPSLRQGPGRVRGEPRTADDYYIRGLARAARGDLEGAVADYSRAVALSPAHKGAFSSRGVVRQQRGDPAGAIADFTRALAIDPEYAAAYTNRGRARQAQGDPQGALADYSRALGLDQTDAVAYNNRGLVRRNAGDPEGALADLNRAIEQDPMFAGAYNNRAGAYLDKGDWERALADIAQAILLDPTDAAPYANRGNALQAQGDLDGAIAAYTRAIELDPKGAFVFTGRGNCRWHRGDLDGAIADHTRAIVLDPRCAAAYSNRGNARRDKGDLEGAIRDHSRAIELDPQGAAAYTNRGLDRWVKGDLQGAIADHTHALGLDSRQSKAYNNRAVARRDAGDLAGAIADLTQAIQLDPRYGVAYLNRGLARAARGDLAGAIEDFTRAIELDPRDAGVFATRGDSRMRAGDLEGAIADCTRAIAIDPKHAAAYNNRGRARSRVGDAKGAIADFERAIQLVPTHWQAWGNLGLARDRQGDRSGAIQAIERAHALAPAAMKSRIAGTLADLRARR